MKVVPSRNSLGVRDSFCVRFPSLVGGIGAFWRGCGPFVNRAMLVGGTQVTQIDCLSDIPVPAWSLHMPMVGESATEAMTQK